MYSILRPSISGHGRLSRREIFRAGALTFAGLTLPNLLRRTAQAQSTGSAKHCILILLNGGMAHQDTFDMKPLAPEHIRGPYQPISTSVPGIQICEKLPKLAQLTDQMAIVRSMNHHLLAHNSGAAYALSGHSPGTDQDIASKSTDHPTYGSVISKVMPSTTIMPSFVLTPTYLFDMGFPTPSAGGGWLGNAYDPFPVVRNRMMARSPEWDGKLPIPEALQLPGGIDAHRLQARRLLLKTVDEEFSAAHQAAGLETVDGHQLRALDLITSPQTQAAFDLSLETPKTHDRYGRFEMGQVMLLARRLIEAGVRFVTANAVANPANTRLSPFQIWDTHFDHFRLYNECLLPEFDQSLSALVTDLEERNLLDETLIVVMGEFGRTPKVTNVEGGGRDHWSRAYSIQLIGGGIRGGMVYGATDKHAAEVSDFPVKPDDIAATIYELLGIPHDLILQDQKGQPHKISEGQPLRAVMS
ncbi:MAG: DUF1501 domain-containing protein [Planctomycetaceae bacterium]